MANRAILIGNAHYRASHDLPCCHDDVQAMKELLEATGKFDDIQVLEDLNADAIKDAVRRHAERQPTGELFFYFSGHGHTAQAEFYLCGTDFVESAPNQTGLAGADLLNLLRLADADVVVVVIDACYSGMRLFKDSFSLARPPKEFGNFILMASSLDSQESLAGYPLSEFTEAFRAAALSKPEGPVYYSDITAALRDAYIANDAQIPWFFDQGTYREQFVDDAKRLDGLKARLQPPVSPPSPAASTPAPPLTPLKLLESAEARSATPEAIKRFADAMFDRFKEKFTGAELSGYFELAIVEHADYQERASDAFIVRCLSRETRTDKFVTAESRRERRQLSLWQRQLYPLSYLFNEPETVEELDVWLNITMERAQIKATLKPKWSSLKQISLIITCAPSLEHVYVFEFAAIQALTGFNAYEAVGPSLYSHWYERDWEASGAEIADKMVENLLQAARSHIEATVKRLQSEASKP
ncbi:MAG: caspase family protein [Hyphomonadaceae bacterium]|nr:caspase family protein [Hyphomonadaceae bacterium]